MRDLRTRSVFSGTILRNVVFPQNAVPLAALNYMNQEHILYKMIEQCMQIIENKRYHLRQGV